MANPYKSPTPPGYGPQSRFLGPVPQARPPGFAGQRIPRASNLIEPVGPGFNQPPNAQQRAVAEKRAATERLLNSPTSLGARYRSAAENMNRIERDAIGRQMAKKDDANPFGSGSRNYTPSSNDLVNPFDADPFGERYGDSAAAPSGQVDPFQKPLNSFNKQHKVWNHMEADALAPKAPEPRVEVGPLPSTQRRSQRPYKGFGGNESAQPVAPELPFTSMGEPASPRMPRPHDAPPEPEAPQDISSARRYSAPSREIRPSSDGRILGELDDRQRESRQPLRLDGDSPVIPHMFGAQGPSSVLPDPIRLRLREPEPLGPQGAEPQSSSDLYRSPVSPVPVAQADPLRPRSAPNFIDRTDSWQHRPYWENENEIMPYEETGRVPLNPRVDEEYLASLPSRSDQARGVMQPGSMGHTEPVEDDGYRFPGRGATPGARFDATRFRNRQEQIDSLDDRVADHAAASGGGYQGAGGAEVRRGGALVTIDSDPSSPTYGKESVQGSQLIGDAEAHADSLARREARIAGKTFVDRNTGKTTDYGKWQDNRAAKKEEADQKRDIRQMRAQLSNWGRRGGVTVDPSRGIAGPLHTGLQPTFGPNMSLNERTFLASEMLRGEGKVDDLMERKQRKEDIESYTELSKTDPAGARQLYPDLFEDSGKKTPAEKAAALERSSQYREMVRNNPQGIIEIMIDVRGQYDSLDEANAELREMGITQDMMNSAMERTEPGMMIDALDAYKDGIEPRFGGYGHAIAPFFGVPEKVGRDWGRRIGRYFGDPTHNRMQEDRDRERITTPDPLRDSGRPGRSGMTTKPPGTW